MPCGRAAAALSSERLAARLQGRAQFFFPWNKQGDLAVSDSDLRAFLELLEEHRLLVELSKPVDLSWQVSQLMRELDRRGLTGLFADAGPEHASVVYNVLGTRRHLALALGCAPDETSRVFLERMQDRVPPKAVTDAPVQDRVHTSEPDLRRLPLVTHSDKDAGPYVTAGMVLAVDPTTGRRNVSVNRMMLVDDREAGIRMMSPQQLGVIQGRAEEVGEDLPVAIAVGLHPLDYVASATSNPLGDDELELAGALKGAPVELVDAVTVPLQVPAFAEYVLEGYVRANVREPEGPFGDFLEFYVPVMDNHRFRLTAITHRRQPIWQTMWAGSQEDVSLLGVSREAAILDAVEALGVRVHGVRIGPTILSCAIACEVSSPGTAQAVGMAALARYRWLKYCIVVDPDVDVSDLDDVWWAVTTRSGPHRITVLPDAGGFPRDPHGLHHSKALIDATAPPDAWPDFERRIPPGTPLKLEDFL